MNPQQTTPKNPIWSFSNPQDRTGAFSLPDADSVYGMVFPLCNMAGMMSAVTPNLKGDVKTGQNSFLTLPVVTEELPNICTGRNFWLDVKGAGIWSAAGESADFLFRRATASPNPDEAVVDAGPGFVTVTRTNRALGLKAQATVFVPANGDWVELTLWTVTNTTDRPLQITATAAVPIFGRSADNLRDHRQVTTMLNRVTFQPNGVVNTPTMSFDERGHKRNTLGYCVLGAGQDGANPVEIWGNLQEFIGEGCTLYSPAAVYERRPAPVPPACISGREAIGAMRFEAFTLAPGESRRFVVLLGVSRAPEDFKGWNEKYLNADKAAHALEEARRYWQGLATGIRFGSGDLSFDNWMVWICCQPVFRKVFGCSFLPEFGYGRGGRGWRDLWQDCLALLLVQPDEARDLLLNNFAGIRIDGSNATIIGSRPGEFIADRNNIPRTWMDHGVWPLITTALYIDQSGDLDLLLTPQKYFKDAQALRCRRIDGKWSAKDYGPWLKNRAGQVYEGSVLEHLIVQNVTQFFNVGEHNQCRLEGADWNDGLDMARERGESVAFTAMYAWNLERLAQWLRTLERRGLKKIAFPAEFGLLFDTLGKKPVDASPPGSRSERLTEYMEKVSHCLSGRLLQLRPSKVALDLETKARLLRERIARDEWISTAEGFSFFNGYYDNQARRVEGDHPLGVRMTLTGQVFPVMSGVADENQVRDCIRSVNRYLKDPALGGYRLNTDFKELQLSLGRAFSFSYGDKENGAFFSHMAVMWMYGLYHRGFAGEGHQVLQAIYRMCVDSGTSRIAPGIPEYFNSEGRGRYHHLTGSAAWMLYTVLTQVFGVRGLAGDLLIYPKLMASQYDAQGTAGVQTRFAGVRIGVTYQNPGKLDFGRCRIQSVSKDGSEVAFAPVDGGLGARIARAQVAAWADGTKLEVRMG